MQSDTRQVPVSAPCPFNAMCSCKTTPSALLQRDAGDADADDAGDQQTVSCVGVPFATLPGAFLFFLGFPWKWKWKKWKCPIANFRFLVQFKCKCFDIENWIVGIDN